MNTISTGDQAPGFKLSDQDGNAVDLADFKGKKTVVLYFYPKAMTPGCTVQACGIRDSRKALADAGCVVLGLSPDSPKRLKKFVDKEQLNFPLLADEEHAVADRYGVWGEKKFMGRTYMGVKRISFIIGPDGIVRHVMDKVKTATHHQDVLDWLRANSQ